MAQIEFISAVFADLQFELSESLARLGPLAEGWFRPLTHASFCLTLQSYIGGMQPICVSKNKIEKNYNRHRFDRFSLEKGGGVRLSVEVLPLVSIGEA